MKRLLLAAMVLLLLCGCAQTGTAEVQYARSGENQIVPYELAEPSVRDGAYAVQLQRGTILYAEYEDEITLAFAQRQREVTIEVWPAWDWAIWNHDAWWRWELSTDKDGRLTLPLTVGEAYLICVTADARSWLFSVDPMPVKPEIEPMIAPPELTVRVGNQTVTAQRGTYSWDRPGSSKNWDASPMFERDAADFEPQTLTVHGSCLVECSTEVAPEKVTAALYLCSEREPVWIQEAEIAEDGSFAVDCEVEQPMILDLWVEMPVNHWIGRAWGGKVDYGVLLLPEG